MLDVPSRVSQLMERIEAGESVTQDDVDRLARLQALDVAKLGEDFARLAAAEDHLLSEALRDA